MAADQQFETSFFFFFQAEDGIRDLVRSRGLGDVYKRQVLRITKTALNAPVNAGGLALYQIVVTNNGPSDAPVSYTHLTLPTSDLV